MKPYETIEYRKPWSGSSLWHPGPTISLLCQRPSNSVPGRAAQGSKECRPSDKDLAVSAWKIVPSKLAEIWQWTILGTLHHLANGRFRALQARCRGTVPATIWSEQSAMSKWSDVASNQEPSGRVFFPFPSMQLCWNSPVREMQREPMQIPACTLPSHTAFSRCNELSHRHISMTNQRTKCNNLEI